MRPWKRAVAVPLLLIALASASLAATRLLRPVPVSAGTHTGHTPAPLLTPPLHHGGCDSWPRGQELATRSYPIHQIRISN